MYVDSNVCLYSVGTLCQVSRLVDNLGASVEVMTRFDLIMHLTFASNIVL